jgi:hypothetical protein
VEPQGVAEVPSAAVEPAWPQAPGVAEPSAVAAQHEAAARRAEAQPAVAVTAGERQAAEPTSAE